MIQVIDEKAVICERRGTTRLPHDSSLHGSPKIISTDKPDFVPVSQKGKKWEMQFESFSSLVNGIINLNI